MAARDVLLTALMGGSPPPTSAGDNVFYDQAPEKVPMKFIVCRRVSTYRDFGLDNTLLGTKETFHVECWGENRADSDDLQDEAVAALVAAGLPPSENEADGLDPTVFARAAVIVVDVW